MKVFVDWDKWVKTIAQQCSLAIAQEIGKVLADLADPEGVTIALAEMVKAGKVKAENLNNLQEHLQPRDLQNSDFYWLQTIKRHAHDLIYLCQIS